MRFLILICVALFGMASFSHGKEFFGGADQMIKNTEAIAIIMISNVRESSERSAERNNGSAYYRQMADAATVTLLKGDLPVQFLLYGGETFECGQCNLAPGRYLAFLLKDGALWVGSNRGHSLRPITDENVEWFQTAMPTAQLAIVPLSEVLLEIKSKIAQP